MNVMDISIFFLQIKTMAKDFFCVLDSKQKDFFCAASKIMSHLFTKIKNRSSICLGFESFSLFACRLEIKFV